MTADVSVIERRVMERIGALLASAAIDPDDVRCRIDDNESSLRIHLDLPGSVGRGLEHALAVRVLDAIRAVGGRTYGTVDVQVHQHAVHGAAS